MSSVGNIIEEINEIGNILPKRRLGKPKSLSERYLRPIIKDINENFFKEIGKIFHKQ